MSKACKLVPNTTYSLCCQHMSYRVYSDNSKVTCKIRKKKLKGET